MLHTVLKVIGVVRGLNNLVITTTGGLVGENLKEIIVKQRFFLHHYLLMIQQEVDLQDGDIKHSTKLITSKK